MSDVYTFIRDGLANYSDDKGIYDCTGLISECLSLNELLNNIKDDDYQRHLSVNKFDIIKQAKILFLKMEDELYTNIQCVYNELFFFQDDKEMQDHE